MIVSYFLFYLITCNERYKYILILSYGVLTVVMTLCPILLPWSLDTAPLTALVMYAGMETRRRVLIGMNGWMVLLLSLLYIGLHCVSGDLNLSFRMYGTSVGLYFVLAILGSFIVLWGSNYLEGTVVGNCFLTLGKHALTIFCIEMAFIVWAKVVYQRLFPNWEINCWTGIFEIVTALVGGWLFSLTLHRIKPLSRLLF